MDQNAHRHRIVLQYFELRIELNRANGLRDDKTQLEFELRSDDEVEFVIIKSSGAYHGLRFAYRNSAIHHVWHQAENEKFKDLFQYLVNGLHTIQDPVSLNTKLTIWLFRLWMN